MAVNAACGLALRHPDRVLLVDLSIQMGVCASMLDLRPPATIIDAVRQRDRLDETLLRQIAAVHSSGLHLLAAPAGAVEAAEIDDEAVARLLTLARRTYDFVIVDTFPMLDRVMIAVLDFSDRVYVVLENVVPTLQGAVKFVKLLDGLGVGRERQRIVLNRQTSLPGSLPPADVARHLGREVNHVLPADKQRGDRGEFRRALRAAGEPVLRLRSAAAPARRRSRFAGRDADRRFPPTAWRHDEPAARAAAHRARGFPMSTDSELSIEPTTADASRQQLSKASMALPADRLPGARRLARRARWPLGRGSRPPRRRATSGFSRSNPGCINGCWTNSIGATCWPPARR